MKLQRSSGILLPIFSLPSRHGAGTRRGDGYSSAYLSGLDAGRQPRQQFGGRFVRLSAQNQILGHRLQIGPPQLPSPGRLAAQQPLARERQDAQRGEQQQKIPDQFPFHRT